MEVKLGQKSPLCFQKKSFWIKVTRFYLTVGVGYLDLKLCRHPPSCCSYCTSENKCSKKFTTMQLDAGSSLTLKQTKKRTKGLNRCERRRGIYSSIYNSSQPRLMRFAPGSQRGLRARSECEHCFTV